MEFDEWEPAYLAILEDFGFDRGADERARDRLAALAESFDPDRLDLEGATVAVAGAGPSLERETRLARDADVVLAASTAGARLDDHGVDVDLVVTDLDGDPDAAVGLARRGIPVAVHAHGDNVPLLEAHIRRFPRGAVLPTTQATPRGPVRNFGGFTDGDRAAFVADHLGAARLVFPGWVLDDPDVDPIKRRKLRWAGRLLRWLERRRDERFDLLEGYREGLTLGWL